jgi:signal transduction histidine kinase
MDAERILVVDDEQGIREGCRRVLAPEGYEVDTAATLAEAAARLEAGRYHLILLDVMLPDGRGIELLEAIRRTDPDTVVAIITGYATVELAVEAIQEGAYDFLSKPFNGDVLLLTVRQGLERRRLAIEARRGVEAERRAAELAHQKGEMERLDKFKSAFMLMVAHELRAPVAAAGSLLRTLYHGMAGELTEPQRQVIGRLEARNAELLDLVNDLLALAASKAQEPEGALEAVRLGAVLDRVIERVRDEAAEKGIGLGFEGAGNPAEVRASTDGLSLIFGNLIGNAVKYTPPGGKVSVAMTSEGGRVRVRVIDSGIGILPEDQARLGEEFFRAANAKATGITGTGLGLSIVRHNLDRFGGEMSIQSEVGRGTTVTVTFPCCESGTT